LGDALDGWDSKLDKASPTRSRDQTGILRFALEIVAYKWLLSVTGDIIVNLVDMR